MGHHVHTSGAFLGFSQSLGKLVLSPPDERDRVQKKTFTKWVNKHLIKVSGGCLSVGRVLPHGCSHSSQAPLSSLRPVIFCPFLPHLLLSLSSSSFWSLSVSAVALEGRGRYLHGAGVCFMPLLLHTQGSAQHLSGSGDSHLWPSWSLLSPQAQRHISDLYEDLRDGHNLISLLEVLSGDSLVCVSLPSFLPSLGPFPSTHSVSSSVSLTFSSLLQPQLLLPGLGVGIIAKGQAFDGHLTSPLFSAFEL